MPNAHRVPTTISFPLIKGRYTAVDGRGHRRATHSSLQAGGTSAPAVPTKHNIDTDTVQTPCAQRPPLLILRCFIEDTTCHSLPDLCAVSRAVGAVSGADPRPSCGPGKPVAGSANVVRIVQWRETKAVGEPPRHCALPCALPCALDRVTSARRHALRSPSLGVQFSHCSISIGSPPSPPTRVLSSVSAAAW